MTALVARTSLRASKACTGACSKTLAASPSAGSATDTKAARAAAAMGLCRFNHTIGACVSRSSSPPATAGGATDKKAAPVAARASATPLVVTPPGDASKRTSTRVCRAEASAPQATRTSTSREINDMTRVQGTAKRATLSNELPQKRLEQWSAD